MTPPETRYELHAHTTLSDGELSPMELLSRARATGHAGIAVTDHAGPGLVERLVREVAPACEAARAWDLRAVPGVEITHVPPGEIPAVAADAKDLGALVVVHGETPVEPVPPGTNRAAASCPDVDILAHPGRIEIETAEAAQAHDVVLEVSARRGHNRTNGLVVERARAAGADLVVDADAHAPSDLLSPSEAWEVALGAGLDGDEARRALVDVPERILERVEKRR